ncbi:MAG: DUF1848 domain-containing protein [Eubacteriales bacterium]|jgi:DNA repair photolyase
MILNTGQRTDIPAFYSDWLINRIHAGFVLVRNPWYPQQVTRYRIDPSVVDLIAFCSKNPAPMLSKLSEIAAYRQFWHVTITPYGRDLEPCVPPVQEVMETFRTLSQIVGSSHIAWRYDPIIISDRYTVDFHIDAFRKMCEQLSGYTHQAIISFIDLYEKTKRNLPGAREVSESDRLKIGKAFSAIGRKYNMRLIACHEGTDLKPYGFDCTGCMTRRTVEQVFGEELDVPSSVTPARKDCNCLLGGDIGAYDSCGHGCLYCYANQTPELARQRMAEHDPASPFLIGHAMPGDIIHEAHHSRWFTGQTVMVPFL